MSPAAHCLCEPRLLAPERSQLSHYAAVLLGERALRRAHAGHRGVESLELCRRAPALLAAALAQRPELLAQRSHLARVRLGGGAQLAQSTLHLRCM